MDKFTDHFGLAAPMMRINIDTDTIIPSKRMRSVSKHGLGSSAFYNWRYLEEDTENPEFVLNQPPYRDASILLSGKNFGCGSSREHAVWALKEYGIKTIIAPSYGTIFYKNCIRNGILPAMLAETKLEQLAESVSNSGDKHCMIDLEKRSIAHGALEFEFEITETDQKTLLAGLDPITQTLTHHESIDQFIAEDQKLRSWAHLD